MEPWRTRALDQARGAGLGAEWDRILAAFAGPPGDVRALPERIEAALRDEVDAEQAALFARRFRQVRALLAGIDAVQARLLEPLLDERAAGILAAPPPRAHRVRALVDYVFAHAAVAVHDDPHAPALAERVRDARLVDVADGIAHATVSGPTSAGPVHLNLLRVRGGTPIVPVDARPVGDLVAVAAARGAPAAFSGGFFLYSEPDIEVPSMRGDPVGALVAGGVLAAPSFGRAALVQHDDGRFGVVRLGPTEVGWIVGGVEVRPASCNDASGARPRVFNRAFGPTAPVRGAAVAAGRVVAAGPGPVPIPLNGVVLELDHGPLPTPGAAVGATIVGVRAAMSGGPRLLGPNALDLAAEDFAGTAPPVTFSQDETFDTNRLPRLGAGVDAAGTLWVAAVDGRDLHRAPGLTLAGTAEVLAALGCEHAVNLDGGSSKRMVVAGRVVDLPSTDVAVGAPLAAAPVRPVRTAILVDPRR